MTTNTAQAPGPWYGAAHKGTSGARYFVVERENPLVTWGGIETMRTKNHANRRFATLDAAQKAADAKNAGGKA